jgi:protein-arginine kinase activator protein McsA
LLQKKLAKAVEAEDFEQAAKVRDELKDLTPRTAEPAKK